MLKFVSGIAIIAFMTWCGYLLAQKYRKKKRFYIQWSDFNERFLNEILYYRRPMREFIDLSIYHGEFQALLFAFFDYLETGNKEDDFQSIFDSYTFLSTDEKGMLRDYFLMVGKGDSASQKNYFSAQKGRLDKLQAESINACNRYGNLYIKIGFLCGLFILILII